MGRVWKKKCPVCGAEFETGLRYTKYCPEHRNAKRAGMGGCPLTPGVCEQCGKPFYGHGNARFCCAACRRRHDRAKSEERKLLSKPGAVAMRACHDCGRPTTDYRCQDCQKAFRQRYCVTSTVDCGEWLYA